jgi:hypothetical protein
MSRPQKIIPPIKGDFNSILTSVAMGSGVGKRAALKLAKEKEAQQKSQEAKPKKSSAS